jgi:hypothetical protein
MIGAVVGNTSGVYTNTWSPRSALVAWTKRGVIQAFLMLEPLSVMDLRRPLIYLGFGRDESEKDDARGDKRRARHQPLARDGFHPVGSVIKRRPPRCRAPHREVCATMPTGWTFRSRQHGTRTR